jgi:DNA repair protein RecN (Recombination protein N)
MATRWRTLRDELEVLRSNEREQADREQLLRYQVGELDELALGDGELAQLENEQRQLENADTIQRQAAELPLRCVSSTTVACARTGPN